MAPVSLAIRPGQDLHIFRLTRRKPRRKSRRMVSHLLLVAAGGGIGAGLRHVVNLGAMRVAGPNYPWGTLAVNLVGSFVMGLFIALLGRRLGGSTELRLFVATGILGGFTTFSSYSLDFATLWERGAALTALGYVLLSVLGAIVALFLGLWLARAIS
jgi:CrcB protein